MGILSRYLWLLPFVVHAAYLTATVRYFPIFLGGAESTTNSRQFFMVEWIIIVLSSNTALLFVLHKMPSFGDKTLGVPNKKYWLRDDSTKAQLIEKLESLVETTLVLINILFLGVYQLLYQSNVMVVAVRLPFLVLVGAFIAFPIGLTFANLLSVRHSLVRGGKSE